MIKLIINADDFGYSKVFNEAILELAKKDLISSTSVMVDWVNNQQENQVKELIEISKTHNFSIGLHIFFKNTNFDEEINRQYDKFIEIFEFKPMHIDIHKAINLHDGYLHIIKFSEQNKIPCKNLGIGSTTKFMTKKTRFSGTKHTTEETEQWLSTLEDNQFYVIIFHPGKFDPESKSTLNKEREEDVKKISILNNLLSKYNIKLVSYLDLTREL